MSLDELVWNDSLTDEFFKDRLGEDAALYLLDKTNQTVSEEIIEQLKIRAMENNNPILKKNLQEFQEDCECSAYDPEKYSLMKQEGVLRIYKKDYEPPVAYLEYTLDHPNFSGEIFVQAGEVELEERGKGLMTRLCQELEEYAKKIGKTMIYVDVDAKTDNMQEILRRLGYELLGTEEYKSVNIDRDFWGKKI